MEKMPSKKQNLYEIIKKFVENMNSLPSTKYKQTPNEIEKNSLNSEASRERFNFLRLKKKNRKEKFNKKIYERKNNKVKIFTRGGRRSTSACFTTKVKGFT